MILLYATACVPGYTPYTTTKPLTATDPPAEDTATGGSGSPWVPITGDTGDTDTTVDSGIATADACPPGVESIREVTCVESDAALGTSPYSSYAPLDLEFQATVTEIGGVLSKIPGSAGLGYEPSCGAAHLHQVRLVDSSGSTWTLGWDIDGSVDDASTDAISVGEDLTVEVANRFWGYGADFAFRLSDATGPVVFYEAYAYQDPLTDEDRGGISAEVGIDDWCLGDDGGEQVRYRPVTFTGPYDSAALLSGQSGTMTLADRAVSLTLAGSEEIPDCPDGCTGNQWTGWETP